MVVYIQVMDIEASFFFIKKYNLCLFWRMERDFSLFKQALYILLHQKIPLSSRAPRSELFVWSTVEEHSHSIHFIVTPNDLHDK